MAEINQTICKIGKRGLAKLILISVLFITIYSSERYSKMLSDVKVFKKYHKTGTASTK